MMCAYGCGTEAKYTLKNGKLCCSKSPNSCVVNKTKNSNALKQSIKENGVSYTIRYESLSDSAKEKMRWNKGKHTGTFFEYNGTGNHKLVLIKERGHVCEVCKYSIWNETPITLELEHIDGDSKNNTKENLRLLCPNCHSQTPTWRRRKSKGNRKKHTEEEIIHAIKTSTSMTSALDKLGLKWGSYTTLLNVMKRNNIDLTIWGS